MKIGMGSSLIWPNPKEIKFYVNMQGNTSIAMPYITFIRYQSSDNFQIERIELSTYR